MPDCDCLTIIYCSELHDEYCSTHDEHPEVCNSKHIDLEAFYKHCKGLQENSETFYLQGTKYSS